MSQFEPFVLAKLLSLPDKCLTEMNVFLVECLQHSKPRNLSKISKKLHKNFKNREILQLSIYLGSLGSTKKNSTNTYRMIMDGKLEKPIDSNSFRSHMQYGRKYQRFNAIAILIFLFSIENRGKGKNSLPPGLKFEILCGRSFAPIGMNCQFTAFMINRIVKTTSV